MPQHVVINDKKQHDKNKLISNLNSGFLNLQKLLVFNINNNNKKKYFARLYI